MTELGRDDGVEGGEGLEGDRVGFETRALHGRQKAVEDRPREEGGEDFPLRDEAALSREEGYSSPSRTKRTTS